MAALTCYMKYFSCNHGGRCPAEHRNSTTFAYLLQIQGSPNQLNHTKGE